MLDYKNKDFIHQIVNSSRKGKLILFLGAGYSKLCGIPLWSELASAMLDDCVKDPLIKFDEASKAQLLGSIHDSRELVSIASSLLIKAHGKSYFYHLLCAHLDISSDKLNPEIREQRQVLIDFISQTKSTVITTNADSLFDQSFPSDAIARSEDQVATLAHRSDQPKILHIHGSILMPNSLVFTTSDYLYRYSDEKFRMALSTIFNSPDRDTSVLFLGYGFSELQLNVDPMSRTH